MIKVDSSWILNFISGMIVLVLLLIIGFNVKNRKVRYNSIRCLKNEKALLEEKVTFNKAHLNENAITLQNMIYEDTIRIQSIDDEILWRYIHYMALGSLIFIILIFSFVYLVTISNLN